MSPSAAIVGPITQTRCNDLGHGPPMIAIPGADDCDPLQLTADAATLPAFITNAPRSTRRVLTHANIPDESTVTIVAPGVASATAQLPQAAPRANQEVAHG